jgi:two-component system response regulator FixJ
MNSSHVYLIDNDARRRDHLARVFDEPPYRLQSFADIATFIDRIDYASIPDAACVVTHLDLAPLNGVDLLKILRADQVTLPAVLIGTHSDLPLAVKALRYGCAWILWRPFPAALLDQVVQSMLQEWNTVPGQAPRQILELPMADGDTDIEQRFASLSRRQRQVLQYVFEGNCNRAIADALGISVKTVELHRACLMKKMCADSVVDLIKMATYFRRSLECNA